MAERLPGEPAGHAREAGAEPRAPVSREAGGTPEPAQVARASPQPLCRSDELAERGSAVVFDVLHLRALARAFVLRFDGRVVAYLNRCAHVPTEMDWQPGQFLDDDREFILCSMHGAAYVPRDGRCAGGPCGRGRLIAIDVDERDGQVYWYPCRDIQPVFAE